MKKNIKIKGNVEIFREMTEQEWKVVSNDELEKIIDAINKEKGVT